MIKLAISGAHGRMGQAIGNLAVKAPDKFKITTLLEHSGHAKLSQGIHGIPVTADNNNLVGCEALIEFTLPEGTLSNLEAAVRHKVPMVIGTTGFSEDQIQKIHEASKSIPIVFASNMSIGVNVLFNLIEQAGQKLRGITDISIGETHHIHKKDAPSGTAKTMKEKADSTSPVKARFDEDKIKREGEVIGYHEITFETEFDTLTIIHNAKDRAMFARGALTAAEFLQDKTSGLYNMQDVLSLN